MKPNPGSILENPEGNKKWALSVPSIPTWQNLAPNISNVRDKKGSSKKASPAEVFCLTFNQTKHIAT